MWGQTPQDVEKDGLSTARSPASRILTEHVQEPSRTEHYLIRTVDQMHEISSANEIKFVSRGHWAGLDYLKPGQPDQFQLHVVPIPVCEL